MSPGQMTSLLYGDAAVSPRPPRTAPASSSRRADAAIAATHLEGCVQPVPEQARPEQARPVRPVVVRAKHPRPAGPRPKPRAGRLCTRERGLRSRQACAPADRAAAVAPRRLPPYPRRLDESGLLEVLAQHAGFAEEAPRGAAAAAAAAAVATASLDSRLLAASALQIAQLSGRRVDPASRPRMPGCALLAAHCCVPAARPSSVPAPAPLHPLHPL